MLCSNFLTNVLYTYLYVASIKLIWDFNGTLALFSQRITIKPIRWRPKLKSVSMYYDISWGEYRIDYQIKKKSSLNAIITI